MSTAEGSNITADQMAARYNKAAMVIDGATHSTMDRSFNQSLYEGLVNFVKNKSVASYDPEGSGSSKNSAQSYKPTQDNTTEFINTYTSVIKQSDIVGLAGFNHATPLNSMMQHAEIDGGVSAFASVKDNVVNELAQKTGFILLDSNISNNQNIASVQFKADQPGFLTALATCEYFVNNLDMYHDNYQDLAVAEFGGVAIPTVVIYMGGFQRGIEF
ncbi:MAG: BMP family ABC transporter substrate-binding protein [Mycoplasmoidaceae bacterium]|nr:BMP family ABC transporter substrate-binding protein [Mycoplasmoidaceae bacterium]